MINRRLKCSNEDPVSEIFLVEEYTVTGLLCQWKVMDTKQNGGQMIKCLDTFEKCQFLFKFKEDKKFNHRNIWNISRTKFCV